MDAAVPHPVTEQQVSRLRSALRLPVTTPGEADYAGQSRVWNAMINRQPSLIATCTDAAEVQTAVRFAREHQLDAAVRCGGHSLPGFGTSDGGMVISLAGLKDISVDPASRRVRVGGGCLLGEIDQHTQEFGLAVPSGVVSHTGIGGLALGGGVGLLMRRYGLTIDHLISAEVVTADGNLLHASADDNTELFWALRGGGGNFGIVTGFEFQAQEVRRDVLALLLAWPLEQVHEVFERYLDFAADAPRELTSLIFLFNVPRSDPYPEAMHGAPAVGVAGMWCGDIPDGLAAVLPLREYGPPSIDLSGPRPFLFMQSMSDEEYPWGRRYYMKTGLMEALPRAAVDLSVEAFANAPHPALEIDFHHLGGAIGDVAGSATAFAHRTAQFAYDLPTSWDNSVDDQSMIEWTKRTAQALDAYVPGGSYLNVEADTGPEVSRRGWGENWQRLVAVKRQYDPTNFFHLNPNIDPARG
ncbi:FAD-binding oxidoreductase [Pseudarthrobacter sp. NIBRBAC000502772]|uniref:FAD-binding oxidoreductase n=1 Tax=Pseudarthrobacter sp. NIBRBAC000502772 TaxID=2590775 RepID=UPI0011304698|nr:FAD-binding oxidoreductase [Pseudarthrobacter sp. NIBRBAC000502772]QDG67030.1 FAD-binding oxidoreductase [Pseudarthrobacter sp. NIBRBAC000502772]